VFRQYRHVRAGRRGELGVDYFDGCRGDGAAAAAEQPDGLLHNNKPVTPPLAHFAGPGTAHVGYGEYNQRAMLALWADCLERPLAPAARTELGAP